MFNEFQVCNKVGFHKNLLFHKKKLLWRNSTTFSKKRKKNLFYFFFWLLIFNKKEQQQRKRQLYNSQNFTQDSKTLRTHNVFFFTLYPRTQMIYYRRRLRRFSTWLTSTPASASIIQQWLSVAFLSLTYRYRRITNFSLAIRGAPRSGCHSYRLT